MYSKHIIPNDENHNQAHTLINTYILHKTCKVNKIKLSLWSNDNVYSKQNKNE